MSEGDVYVPRPGSHIYRRTDGGDTNVGYQVSAAAYYEGFAGVTDEERLAAELRQPEEMHIADADDPDTEVVIERLLTPVEVEPPVIVAPSVPAFGEWEELPSWPLR